MQRGTVVSRGAGFAVVWDSNPRSLIVLPIVAQPHEQHRADVPLSDFLGRAVVIRAGVLKTVPREGATAMSTLPDRVMARVFRARSREVVDRCVEDRWAGVQDAPGDRGRMVLPKRQAA